ncbi:oxygenase MpaB family protein [Croceicoccus mobilis]|uniref:ER-bound oxygenase mpaB/mpaB'/Rubber oxygenase catalytic domain-containing protein n=1 Tax=Croceicoccus mobilis TaxID=1703339 RepID=A0A916YVW1_9SPHN|nr:oxygenase MpaB family protein [Croceicoccus mobilis]GGD63472.1 hypothetical protein GCM10010990_11200 [Croceicoccus mobilis]
MTERSEPVPARLLRHMLVTRVRSLFNDRSKGEAPVMRSPDALYDPASAIWRVHGDVTTMMIGGVAALLMQMLHPAALAGVWDHSNFRHDMLGRLRRTARFIAVTTYAERAEAEAAIERVKAIHAQVRGELPDGTPYRADDPHLLAWVHLCETIGFLDAWTIYGDPAMPHAQRDEYVRQSGLVAKRLGADPVPSTRAEVEAMIGEFMPELRVDDRTREIARLVLSQPARSLSAAPAQELMMRAAIDLMPRWAQDMHGRHLSRRSRPLVRAGAHAMTRTLNWAFADKGAKTRRE